MSTLFVILVIICHFSFDWLQPRIIQNNKHKDTKILGIHTLQSMFPFFVINIIILHSVEAWIIFSSIFYITHFITDYISSRMAQKAKDASYEKGLIVVTAIDQMIHLVTYLLLYDMIFVNNY